MNRFFHALSELAGDLGRSIAKKVIETNSFSLSDLQKLLDNFRYCSPEYLERYSPVIMQVYTMLNSIGKVDIKDVLYASNIYVYNIDCHEDDIGIYCENGVEIPIYLYLKEDKIYLELEERTLQFSKDNNTTTKDLELLCSILSNYLTNGQIKKVMNYIINKTL